MTISIFNKTQPYFPLTFNFIQNLFEPEVAFLLLLPGTLSQAGTAILSTRGPLRLIPFIIVTLDCHCLVV